MHQDCLAEFPIASSPRGRGARPGRRIVVSTCIVLLGIGSIMPATAAIPTTERDVLIALYQDANGNAWANNSNWCNGSCPTTGTATFNTAGTECTWFGVTCDASGTHVTGLALGGDNLTGMLPSDISPLSALTSFDVSSNVLTGSIPAISNLSSLTYFDASSNKLSGSMPALGGLTALVHFDVFNNQLTGSITPLAGLTALQFFGADSNRLTGTIPPLAGLTALQTFDVDSNGDGNGNYLSGPIPDLGGLTNLQSFLAFNNALTGPIPPLTGLTSLTNFVVNSNALSGTIPPLTGLAALQTFIVYGNLLSGSIPDLSSLTALQMFKVDNNQLTGPPPTAPSGLLAGQSTLCPNPLTIGSDPAWDAATGNSPWWGSGLGGGCSDVIFANGFELP